MLSIINGRNWNQQIYLWKSFITADHNRGKQKNLGPLKIEFRKMMKILPKRKIEINIP